MVDEPDAGMGEGQGPKYKVLVIGDYAVGLFLNFVLFFKLCSLREGGLAMWRLVL